MELQGDSYEEIYLQFKDFMHGDQNVPLRADMSVCPPESVQVFFDLERTGQLHEISQFKGSYLDDIRANCSSDEVSRWMKNPPQRQENTYCRGWGA
jgi:hypothetical protein